MMHLFQWLCGGIVGGAIGASGWVAIEYFTKSEFGWIAWPVGLLVGLGVHKAAAADSRNGFLRGAVAVVLALVAVVCAKYALMAIMMKQTADVANPVASVSSEQNPDVSEEGTESGSDVADTAMPEQSREGLMESAMSSRSARRSLKDMDMVWLCLAAVTAYLVGKGSGSVSLLSEEQAAAAAAGVHSAE